MMARPPYVMLGNGAVAVGFLEAMRRIGYPPALVVLNTPSRQREGASLREACEVSGVPAAVWDEGGRAAVARCCATTSDVWLVSIYFGHVIGRDLLAGVRGRAVNLHPSLLPWNRGVHTNVWPIVERTPAGVSLHVMAPQVDRGAVLAQASVSVEPWDTGATLYKKLEDEALGLLVTAWPDAVLAAWPGHAQAESGSEHRLADFKRLERYDVDAHPEVRRFFDLLRGRTFHPHRGLTVRVDGVDVDATVALKPADG